MNNMRDLRKSRGLTMKDLGRIVGVSESTISLYETGKHEPDIITMGRIADALGVSVDELIGRQISDDDYLMDLRDSIRKDPNLRTLFDLARKATPSDVRAAAAMLKALDQSDDD